MTNDNQFTVLDSEEDVYTRGDGYEYIFITEFKSDNTVETIARLKADYVAELVLDGNLMPNQIVDFSDGNRANYHMHNLYVRNRTPEDPPTNYRVVPHYQYPDDYLVGDVGVLLSRRTNTVLKSRVGTTGYPRCTSTVRGEYVTLDIHLAVAVGFIPNPENKPQVNHKDGIKTNCYFDNLEWSTSKENAEHARAMGLTKTLYGEKAPSSTISDQKRLEIAEYALTHSQKETANVFGVSAKVVRVSCKFKQRKEDEKNGLYFNGVKMV